MQNLPGPTSEGVNAQAQRKVLKSFLDQHPDIQIEPFAMPKIAGSAMDIGPLMAIAAGIPPHGIYVNFRQSSTYVEQGFLEPMEVLLARILSDNEQVRQWDNQNAWLADPSEVEIQTAIAAIKARTPKPAWPVVYRPNFASDSTSPHIWALPTRTLVVGLLYRKDLFQEAGLNPDKPPSNWTELLEYARALRDPIKRQYGMVFDPSNPLGYEAYTFIVSQGGRAVKESAPGVWEASFASPQVAEAAYFFWQLLREPFTKNGTTINGAAGLIPGGRKLDWNRGKVGMIFSYLDSELLDSINPQLVGIAPVPEASSGVRASEINSEMLGVFSQSTPAQKLAVMRYIWYITGSDAERIRTETFVENRYGMFVNPELLEKYGYQRILQRVPPSWRETFNHSMEDGVPEPYGRNTQSVYRWMSLPFTQTLDTNFEGMPKEQAIKTILGYLESTAQEMDEKALGNISPEQMRIRRIGALIVLGIVIASFAIGFRYLWRYFTQIDQSLPANNASRRIKVGYLLLIPGLSLILMWQYLPLLGGGLSIAFMDYRIALESVWVGIDNFANVLFDDKFWAGIGRTFYFVALMLGLGFWPPILLAILLQEAPTNTAKYIFRTIFYLPSVLSGIVVMFLWKQLYDPSPTGILNTIIMSVNALDPIFASLLKLIFLAVWLLLIFCLIYLPFKLQEQSTAMKVGMWLFGVGFILVTLWPIYNGLSTAGLAGASSVIGSLFRGFQVEPMRWLENPSTAMLCVVIPTVWATSGPGCIIYLAALKTVPEELYEAAEIDGANFWHKVFYIVLPRLKFLILIQFVAAVVAAFKGGQEFILVMTGGGPAEATTILSLEIFFRTFLDLEFGIGTAMAWLLGALLIGFTAYQLRLLANAEFKGGN
ncbi:extracellular solute-binding protein [Cerasicoccus frondis]|uniref:extracellular solute-binding protein n=1 Tax=Cerasicoccus frondis TaxID=490090 RepID=UPI0028528B4A|nr:extracellular solute-binding protein [Cerasicoccus frondis]